MVKMWAEKEFRNLNRLYQAGIPCPKPILLRQHVLVMSFIGEDGVAAPRLKVSLPAICSNQTFSIMLASHLQCSTRILFDTLQP
jgi:serine/threonine-protein kinase RIO1